MAPLLIFLMVTFKSHFKFFEKDQFIIFFFHSIFSVCPESPQDSFQGLQDFLTYFLVKFYGTF